MTRPATADEQSDHSYDLRKHEPRPTDLINAIEVAVLVKAVSITIGAELIDQYARTVAAGARLDGVAQAYERIDAALKGASNAQG